MEVSGYLVGSAAFKAVGASDPRTAGSIPVHLRHSPLHDPGAMRLDVGGPAETGQTEPHGVIAPTFTRTGVAMKTRTTLSTPHRPRALFVGIVIGLVALAGCGDDDTSAQEEYCAAGESLQSSVAALADLDLVAGGTDSLSAAVDSVQDDVSDLSDSASDAAADEIDALKQSVDDLESAFSDLADEISTENASALGAAIQNVGTAAQAVYGTLTDCP